MQFKKIFYTTVSIFLFSTLSIAETIDETEFSETQAIIESQLKAFINKDAEGAVSYTHLTLPTSNSV